MLYKKKDGLEHCVVCDKTWRHCECGDDISIDGFILLTPEGEGFESVDLARAFVCKLAKAHINNMAAKDRR